MKVRIRIWIWNYEPFRVRGQGFFSYIFDGGGNKIFSVPVGPPQGQCLMGGVGTWEKKPTEAKKNPLEDKK